LEEIVFGDDKITVVCDWATKERFVEEATNLLVALVEEQEPCHNFNSKLYIEIFRKYHQSSLEEMFNAKFEVNDSCLTRINYTKYSDRIQEKLK
jgi:hypothetical protein